MDKVQPQLRQSTRKRVIIYIFVGFGVFVACVTAWQLFLYINPQARVDFSVYEPKKLPGGYHISDTSLDIWSNRLWFALGIGVDLPFPYAVRVTQDINKNGWSISQEKNKDFSYTCPRNSAFSVCQVQSTQAGQKYRLTIATYSQPSTAADEYVDLLKGNAHITVRVSADKSNLVPATDWSDLIDSFAPVSLAGVNVHYYHPGP